MEAQLHRPSHGHEDGGTNSVVDGGGEREQQHHDKKSVLKKVKDKAKKMKDTVKKHAHLHQHHHNDQEDHRQVHGAPMHESTVVRSINLPKESNSNPNNSPATTTEQRSDHQLNPVSEQGNQQNNNPKGQDAIAGKISSATGAVADKAISAKNMVASKLGYSGSGEDTSNGQSMKEYLCEKVKPGDEDKALSEAITGALHKKEQKPKRGKVTVSKEVADRLGTTQDNKREGEDALASGEESSGQGMAERLQNAVSSWLGKSNGIETAQDSVAHAYVSDAASGAGPMSKEPPHH